VETMPHAAYKPPRKRPDAKALHRELMALDRTFAKDAARNGAVKAYRAILDPHARALRDGLVPLVGKEDVLAYLVRGTAVRNPQPMDGGGSKAGDFGYTYGSFGGKGKATPTSGYYLRIWRRNAKGAWRIACEVAEPAE